MTRKQMKAVLAECQQGKTLLYITKKKQGNAGRRLKYFAVFTNFVEKHDERYTE